MSISVFDFHRRLQRVRNIDVLQDITLKIVKSDQEQLKDRKKEEFTNAERPDGSRIGRYRDAEYAFFKQAINPIGDGYVDLMLTRSFVNNMFVRPFTKGTFLFDSTDSKTGNLVGKYGLDIMGINQEWFAKRQKEIYKFTFINELKKKIYA